MKKTLTLDFCKMTIHDNYMVVVMNEGINITPNHNNVLLEITENYFLGKPFVYITNRINSYSVDPKIYFETAKIENLVGFAVVSNDYKAKTNAEVEKLFFTKPFKIFSKLSEAAAWADNFVNL